MKMKEKESEKPKITPNDTNDNDLYRKIENNNNWREHMKKGDKKSDNIGNILVIITILLWVFLILKVLHIIPGTPQELYTIGTGGTLTIALCAVYYKTKSFIQGEMKSLRDELNPFTHKVTKLETRCDERTPIYEKHIKKN